MKKEDILKKVERVEFIKRCIEAHICPECGEDFKNQSAPSSHWTELACPNKKCTEYHIIKKSWY